MTRITLPNKRDNITENVIHRDQHYYITYGLSHRREVREVFCTTAAKEGTDLKALINDGCILMSILLQQGISVAKIADALGEDRAEGSQSGPASSLLGAIARAGAKIELAL